MASLSIFRVLFACLSFIIINVAAQTAPSTASASRITGNSTATASPTISTGLPSSVPDVYLNVPTLSVGRIELDVDELEANINLNAQVANLVTINAGVQVSVQKINITIEEVDVQLELVVRLGNLVAIVERVFESLDLNPSLVTGLLNNVTSDVGEIVGAVDGLLGSITQGGNVLNFVVDNLGNIVQEVNSTAGALTSSIVGNYLTNMTFTGVEQTLSNGNIQKTYQYSPLNALVNIVFNAAGQVVSAVTSKVSGGSGTSSTASSSAATSTATST